MPRSEPTHILPHASRPRHAFLVKLTDEAWEGLRRAADAGGDGLSITLGENGSLNIPSSPVFGLNASSISPPSEIYLPQSSSLNLHATASARLQVPLTSVPTALQEKLRSSTDAAEQARKDRKLLVMDVEPSKRRAKGLHGGMEKRMMAVRTPSAVPTSRPPTPATPALPSRAGTPAKSTPVVPLKTRIMQLLALGPRNVDDVVAKVGGGEDEVARVLKVVATPSGSVYSLLPHQYAKVKIAAWPAYTRAEQQQVKKLATAAFDKLGLPPDADERAAVEAACNAHGSPVNQTATPVSTSPPQSARPMSRYPEAGPSIPAPAPIKPRPTAVSALTRSVAGMTRSSSMANISTKPSSLTNTDRKEKHDLAHSKRKPSSESDQESSKPSDKPLGSAIRKLRAEAVPTLKRSTSMPAKVVEADGRSAPKDDVSARRASKRPASPDYTSSGSSDNERARLKKKTRGRRSPSRTDPSPDVLRARYDALLLKHQSVEDEIRRLRRWLERIAEGRNKALDGESVDMARAGEDVLRLIKKRAKIQDEMEDIQEWFTD